MEGLYEAEQNEPIVADRANTDYHHEEDIAREGFELEREAYTHQYIAYYPNREDDLTDPVIYLEAPTLENQQGNDSRSDQAEETARNHPNSHEDTHFYRSEEIA
jgi:hypothetical protein